MVDILEYSVLPVAVLQGLQPQTFDLATVHFTALTGGAPGVYIADSLVSDGYGNRVTEGVVPEPGSWVLLLTAMAGLGGALRRRG